MTQQVWYWVGIGAFIVVAVQAFLFFHRVRRHQKLINWTMDDAAEYAMSLDESEFHLPLAREKFFELCRELVNDGDLPEYHLPKTEKELRFLDEGLRLAYQNELRRAEFRESLKQPRP